MLYILLDAYCNSIANCLYQLLFKENVMSKRNRPHRRDRTEQQSRTEQPVAPLVAEAELIYPELTREVQNLLDRSVGCTYDSNTLLYRSAASQQVIYEAADRIIVYLSEILPPNKTVQSYKSSSDGVPIITFIGIQAIKEKTMTNEQQEPLTETAAAVPVSENVNPTVEQPMSEQQPQPETAPNPETQAQGAQEEPTQEEPSALRVIWDRMADLADKDNLPDMNKPYYTSTTVMSQIASVVNRDPENRKFLKGEHRMAEMIHAISDSSFINMIPYVNHLRAEMDLRDDDNLYADVVYDFAEFGKITFTAEAFKEFKHPESMRHYASTMHLRLDSPMSGSMGEYMYLPEEVTTGYIHDHKKFASMVNKARLIHYLFTRLREKDAEKEQAAA